MNDKLQEAAVGQQCGTCGGRIGEGDGYEIADDEEILAYLHKDCA